MRKIVLIFFIILFIAGCSSTTEKNMELYIEDNLIGNYVLVLGEEHYVDFDVILEKTDLDNYHLRQIDNIKESGKDYINLIDLVEKTPFSYSVSGDRVNLFLSSESLIDFQEALKILEEGKSATIFSIDRETSFDVRRVVGGYATIADVEPVTKEDTEKLLELAGGNWGHKRIPIIVLVDDIKIAGSIAPFPHSGREDRPFGEEVDYRSGNTGAGINLNSIRDNNMNGVVDIYFYNSLIPGLNRIDAMHQSKVIEASASINQGDL